MCQKSFRHVSRRLMFVNLTVYELSSLCEKSFYPQNWLMYVCLCVCVWVCNFSSSVCQCKISLPCIIAKRVVPVEAQLNALSCPQFFPSLPLPSSLQPSEELKRRENKWRFFSFTPPLSSTPRPPKFPPPPLLPPSRWSTPSCPLLQSGLPLRWWWLCRRRGHHPSPWPRGSDTFLWKEWEKKRKRETGSKGEREGKGRRHKIAEPVKAKHWNCKMTKASKTEVVINSGVPRCSNMTS